MRAIAVDDEVLMLGALVAAIEESSDISEVAKFLNSHDALDFVKENGLSVKYIVLTHSHFDHAHYVGEYRELLPEAKLCIHKDEAPLMNDPEANVSYLFSSSERYGYADKELSEGEVLSVGSMNFRV